MKELYQQAVADSERVTKINAAEEIQHATNARSIKERFEKGKPISHSDDEDESKTKENLDEDVFAAGKFFFISYRKLGCDYFYFKLTYIQNKNRIFKWVSQVFRIFGNRLFFFLPFFS